MTKEILVKLRCRAWGITEDEYYCNQCSDFSLEDMARAYRRGKNKGRNDIVKELADLKERLLKVENAYKKKFDAEWRLNELYQKLLTDYANATKCSQEYFTRYITREEQLTKAKKLLKTMVQYYRELESGADFENIDGSKIKEAEQFIKENEKQQEENA